MRRVRNLLDRPCRPSQPRGRGRRHAAPHRRKLGPLGRRWIDPRIPQEDLQELLVSLGSGEESVNLDTGGVDGNPPEVPRRLGTTNKPCCERRLLGRFLKELLDLGGIGRHRTAARSVMAHGTNLRGAAGPGQGAIRCAQQRFAPCELDPPLEGEHCVVEGPCIVVRCPCRLHRVGTLGEIELVVDELRVEEERVHQVPDRLQLVVREAPHACDSTTRASTVPRHPNRRDGPLRQ